MTAITMGFIHDFSGVKFTATCSRLCAARHGSRWKRHSSRRPSSTPALTSAASSSWATSFKRARFGV
ncbi:hypothetical protein E4K10_04955 [Streptomyces sp. T1317-0309]|nr:hypothetical protein E4K10_04955 [Streptomyces sp. T1317-0309]